MPAAQSDTENCVAHNGSLVPVPGRDIMVQGWYQGGISVFDFTDSAHPVEIAYFDRGPIDAKNLITGGYWSAYWYNGNIYGAEIARGIDVFRLTPSEFLSENELAAANLVRFEEFNASSSRRSPGRRASSWPRRISTRWCAARPSTRRAPRRCETALDRGDTRAGRSGASLSDIDGLATQLETDAAAPGGARCRRACRRWPRRSRRGRRGCGRALDSGLGG